MRKEIEQARNLLLEELTGTRTGGGTLFQADYTLLLKVALLVRLEGQHPLYRLVQAIGQQQPAWRIEVEAPIGVLYLLPTQWMQQHPDQRDMTAWLTIQHEKTRGMVAMLHLEDGDTYVLVVPDDPLQTRS